MRRKIQIVAIERTRIIERAENVICPVCFSNEGLVTSGQAATLFQVGAPSIRRWVAQGQAHGFKTPGGRFRICRVSLLLRSANESTASHDKNER